MIYLALDVGSQTIGLARCNAAEDRVDALYTLTRLTRKRDVARVVEEAQRLGAGALVAGLAVFKSGDEGESAARARRIGELCATASGLLLYFQDELDSSLEARERLLSEGASARRIAEEIDCQAARIILERFLAKSSEERAKAISKPTIDEKSGE